MLPAELLEVNTPLPPCHWFSCQQRHGSSLPAQWKVMSHQVRSHYGAVIATWDRWLIRGFGDTRTPWETLGTGAVSLQTPPLPNQVSRANTRGYYRYLHLIKVQQVYFQDGSSTVSISISAGCECLQISLNCFLDILSVNMFSELTQLQ